MPLLALGLWNMGACDFHTPLSPREGKDIIKKAYQKGTKAFDTAFSYSGADSMLYSAMREKGVSRDEYEIWSKVMPLPTLRKKVDASRRRLGSDYFDILMLHWPTKEESLFSSLITLESLKNEGITKEIGVSNFPLSLLSEVIRDFPISFHERPLSLIWNKEWEEEKKLPINTIAYSPGGFGLLSGKYFPSNLPKDERKTIKALYSPLFPSLLEEIKTLGHKYNVSPYSIAYSWVYISNPWAIVRGVGNEKDLDIVTIQLEEDEIKKLTSIAKEISLFNSSDNIFSHNWMLQ